MLFRIFPRLTESALHKTLYLLGGLAPVVTGVGGTMILNHKYKSLNLPSKERKYLVFQEATNQGINIGFHLASYFGLAWAVGNALKGSKSPARVRYLWTLLAANIGGLVGAAILRPLIGSQIVAGRMEKERSGATTSKSLPINKNRPSLWVSSPINRPVERPQFADYRQKSLYPPLFAPNFGITPYYYSMAYPRYF